MYFYVVIVILLVLFYYFAEKSPLATGMGGGNKTGAAETREDPNYLAFQQRVPPNVIIFKGFWSVDDVRAHPKWLFIFGDNDQRHGKGGQAVIRGEPNAYGIPTKKNPTLRPDSFYNDAEYENNLEKIDNAIDFIRGDYTQKKFEKLVFPEKGLGTGLAQLHKRAPRTFIYLQKRLEELAQEIAEQTQDRTQDGS